MSKKLQTIKTPVAAAVAEVVPAPVIVETLPVGEVTETGEPAPEEHVAPLFTFTESGAKMGRCKLMEGRLLGELCEHLKSCDFAAWNTAKLDFCAGAKSVGYLAPDDLWDKALKAGRGLGLIGDKPATPIVESAERDARRKVIAAQVAKLTEGKTVADLASETETRAKEFQTMSAGVAVAAKDFESAKTDKAREKAALILAAAQGKAKEAQNALRMVQEARDKMAKDASQAATKAAHERSNTLRATLRGLIPTATDAELVAAIKCIKVKPAPVKAA